MTFENIQDAKMHLFDSHEQEHTTDEAVIATCGTQIVNCKFKDVGDYNRHKNLLKMGGDDSAYHPGKNTKTKKRSGPRTGSTKMAKGKVSNPKPQGQSEGQAAAGK